MLRYARHYGLARPPSWNKDELLRNCQVNSPKDSTLADCQSWIIHSSPHREQLWVLRDTLSFLHSVLERSDESIVVKLPRGLASTLDYPLDKRKWLEELSCRVPQTLNDVAQGIPKFQISDDSLSIEQLALYTAEHLSSFTAESIAGNAPILEDVLKLASQETPLIVRLTPRIEPPELHIELPLLPILRPTLLRLSFESHAVEAAPDLFEEELQTFTSEHPNSSSGFIESILARTENCALVCTLKKSSMMEIDMPLTPRPKIRPGVETPSIVCYVSDALKNIPAFSSDTISPSKEYPTMYGMCKTATHLDLFANEEFIVYDNTLKLIEPEVKALERSPDWTKLPTTFEELVPTDNNNHDESVHAVKPVSTDLLDSRMSWNPFGRVLPQLDHAEVLLGEAIIEDYLPDTSSVSPVEPMTALQTSNIYHDHLSSPLTLAYRQTSSIEYRRSSCSRKQECAGLHNERHFQNSKIEYKMRGSGAWKARASRSSSPMQREAFSDFTVPQPERIDLPSFDAVTATFPQVESSETFEQVSTSSPSPRHFLPPRMPAVDPHGDTSPETVPTPDQEQKDRALEIIVTSDNNCISSRPSSQDSLLQALRKRLGPEDFTSRKRRAIAAFDIRANINRHMRLMGRQVSEPRSEDPCPMAQRSPVATVPILIVPPSTEISGAQYWWIMSTSLLGNTALSRPLRMESANVTFMERDLSRMTEADLILSPTTGLVIFHLQHLLNLRADVMTPPQERIVHLSRKYTTLLVLVTHKSSTEDEEGNCTRFAVFQGWVSCFSGVRIVRCAGEIETQQYLMFLSRSSGQQLESLQPEESWTEQCFQQCPFLNAMSAQMLARRTSLYAFLTMNHAGKLQLLQHVGLGEDCSLAVAAYFSDAWHA